jgi:hypothetical protein
MPIEYLGVMIPILAIVMGISLGFFGVWTSHKQKLAKLQVEAAKAAAGNGGEQTREIKEWRERVGVLERIVTDGGYDLATRIEALRDERQIEATSEAAREAERLS